jgi:hypothetical protein
MKRVIRLSTVALFLFSSAINAHHSEAAFNHDIINVFEGTVTNISWRNPHIFLYVETMDKGEKVEWKLETGSTPVMTRSGWSRGSVKPGDTVQIRSHPENDPNKKIAILLSLEKEDGSIYAQDDVLHQPLAVADGFNGIWKKRSTDTTDFTPRLQNLELTAAGKAAKDAYDVTIDNPLNQCIGYPAPRLVDNFTYVFEMELLEERLMIYSDYLDAHRIVYLDGRGHPEDGERTIQGHSIGHWEDEVLVIDTQLFADHRSPNRNGVPSGVQKHVVERYRLSEDKTRMLVDVFMSDPEYLAETFEGTVTYYYSPLLERYDYNCEPAVFSE